jgi:transglutaminase-like putative cysteine protease
MHDALAGRRIPPRLLGALLMLLAALVAPHASNLSPPVLAFFYLSMLWRLLVQRRPVLMPPRWVLVPLVLVGLALVVLTTGFDDGRLTGTALLVVMLGLKLLELNTRRDFHFALFLGYFLILTQFLYNQSLWLAAYLFLGLAALIVLQVGLNRGQVDLGRQLRQTLGMLAAALPLALVVFLLFPRLQNPLWAINTASAVTGISDEMSLNSIGELTRSNATAFRVQFQGPPPDPAQRYWRGPVLWETDGRRWTPGPEPIRSEPLARPEEAAIAYEVTLEPTGERWLFGLDVVSSLPQGARLNHNFALVANRRVNQRFSYRAASDPDFRIENLSTDERELGLSLPHPPSDRVSRLVAGWQADTDPGQPLQLVRKALSYFREEPFVYTLAPGTGPEGGDPVDRFLFETRRGFCEHYAASFATLMRAAGIPSRIVVGYLGGEKNPHADHWVVRQSDAHAWTEVWIPSLGWMRVDPTAAVAPERVEQPINTALSWDADQVVFRGIGDGLFAGVWDNALWLADAVDVRWHSWVVGFSAERQTNLLARFGLNGLNGLGLAIALLVGAVLAAGFVYLMTRLPRPRAGDPLRHVWRQFVHKLERAEVAIAPWHGPDTLCSIASNHYPDAGEQLAVICRMYVQLRYGKHQDRRLLRALRRRIRLLRLR